MGSVIAARGGEKPALPFVPVGWREWRPKMSANKNSFQLRIKDNSPAASIPGAATGTRSRHENGFPYLLQHAHGINSPPLHYAG